MNLLLDAFAWLADPSHWGGATGIGTRLTQHLLITAAVVVFAALIAIPTGIMVGHSGRGRTGVVMVSSGARAIPTLGLLTLLGLMLGIGLKAPVLALIVLAIPSLLAGAYAGIESVSPTVVDAANAIGMNKWQVIRRVEIPLAAPVIVGGIRAATLQVVATATLAAYTADFGLGRYIFAGLKTRDYAQMLAGALLVTFLALILEILLAVSQRLAYRISTPASLDTPTKKTKSMNGMS